jgi:dTDP-4-dehydrorhamnose reductase
MLLILGGSGYVGSAFRKLFDDKSIAYRSVSRKEVDYASRDSVTNLIRETKPTFLINAAGYTGKPNVDACELHKADCLQGNAVLPGILREACEQCNLPWGHVSSGCIYTGTKPDGSGFTELDKPNFSFRTNNCSFYSGCKALGEECLDGSRQNYIWRLRIPFNQYDSGRNYLSKLMNYNCLLDATNSVSQLDEFVAACWQTWEKRIPFGIYNITNTGYVTTRQVVELIKKHLKVDKEFKFFDSEEKFMQLAAKTPRSNCVLDNSKLLNAGIHISDVTDAIEQSLKKWTR